jgi:GNAT superfamily N-acetyltransferase
MVTGIKYKVNAKLDMDAVIEVIKSSGLVRPVDDVKRIRQMLDSASLIVTAWKGLELAGIARSLTDHCYCCYLSDLAVKKEYQRQGIGKTLIEITKEIIGEQTMLLLLSSEPAMEYYPKLGLEKADNAFSIKRIK